MSEPAPAHPFPPQQQAPGFPDLPFAPPPPAASQLATSSPLALVPQTPAPLPALATPEAALDLTMPLQPVGAVGYPDSPALPEPAHPQMPQPETTFPAALTVPAGELSVAGSAEPEHHFVEQVLRLDDLDAAPDNAWMMTRLALVASLFALTLQLVSYYAREQLPVQVASGAPLDKFDTIVGGLPLVSGLGGSLLGMLLAATALGLVFMGYRGGVRERVVQAAVVALGGIALIATAVLPAVAG